MGLLEVQQLPLRGVCLQHFHTFSSSFLHRECTDCSMMGPWMFRSISTPMVWFWWISPPGFYQVFLAQILCPWHSMTPGSQHIKWPEGVQMSNHYSSLSRPFITINHDRTMPSPSWPSCKCTRIWCRRPVRIRISSKVKPSLREMKSSVGWFPTVVAIYQL